MKQAVIISAVLWLYRITRSDCLDQAQALLEARRSALAENKPARLYDIVYELERIQPKVEVVMCHTKSGSARHKQAELIWSNIKEALAYERAFCPHPVEAA